MSRAGHTILIVDDEPPIRRALTLNLAARGFHTFEATDGGGTLTAVAAEHPDLVLLDLGLPGMDGITVLEALRGWTQVPVIVLTARDEERSKVNALEAGADDYVTKPFGMAELVARIRAVLRRRTPDEPMVAEVRSEGFRVDLAARRAFVGANDEEVRLTPIEFAIVAHLLRFPGRLATHRQLTEAVWGPTAKPDANLLRVHLGHIRRKLEPDPPHPRYFITDPGVGFRFEPDPSPG